MFKRNGLKVTIQANKKSNDFLGVTFDPRNILYKPNRKQNKTYCTSINIATTHQLLLKTYLKEHKHELKE